MIHKGSRTEPTAFPLMIPNIGYNTNGKRAVTASGTTSVTQYTAISKIEKAHADG